MSDTWYIYICMILCIDYTVYTYYTVKYQHQYVNHNFYILLCKQVNMILARNVILNIAKKTPVKIWSTVNAEQCQKHLQNLHICHALWLILLSRHASSPHCLQAKLPETTPADSLDWSTQNTSPWSMVKLKFINATTWAVVETSINP